MPKPTVDFAPLEKALTIYYGGVPPHTSSCSCIRGGTLGRLNGACWSGPQAGELLGFSADAINCWRRKGHLPARHADQIAIRLGRMPYEIWPEWEEWANHMSRRRVGQQRGVHLV